MPKAGARNHLLISPQRRAMKSRRVDRARQACGFQKATPRKLQSSSSDHGDTIDLTFVRFFVFRRTQVRAETSRQLAIPGISVEPIRTEKLCQGWLNPERG